MTHQPMNPTPDAEDALLPVEGIAGSRRSFLRLAGFGIASTVLAGCSRGPVRRAVTYLEAPDGIVAGRGYKMATTCAGCTARCGALARCRDGRPIKLEGLPDHPLSGGGLCAVGQAEVLSLYDAQRFDGPRAARAKTTWANADREVARVLAKVRKDGGKVRVLTETVTSPSTQAAIDGFCALVKDGRHVVYDALSSSAILDAHERTHGRRVLPRYRFDRAEVIASFDADFLGTWISPVGFARDYASGRRPDGDGAKMSRHWQFEARVSLTGGRADRRLRVAPWETGAALAGLCDLLGKKAGRTSPASGSAASAPHGDHLAGLADELWAARGRSIVVCGDDDVGTQTLANLANDLLGNYGTTVDLERPSRQKLGRDGALSELRTELASGQVALLIVDGANPVYDLAFPGGLGGAIEKAGLLVSTAGLEDETSQLAHVVCPSPHFLEAWDDAEPIEGILSLTQPTVPPLRDARSLRASLSVWSGGAADDRALVEAHWKQSVHPRAVPEQRFATFFRQALHDGFIELPARRRDPAPFQLAGVRLPDPPAKPDGGRLAVVVYPKVSMLDGRHAHNPWLQELADPVSRIAWESYAVLSPATAERLDVAEGDVVRLRTDADGSPVALPVHLQLGQHDGVVAVARGYGRSGTDRFADIGPDWWEGEATVGPGGRIGESAAHWLTVHGETIRTTGTAVAIATTSDHRALASVQEYHSLVVPPHLAPEHGEIRRAARTVELDRFREDPEHEIHGAHHHPTGNLWPADHAPEGNRWGMVVDLSACTGCSGCVVACQAENNIPVVGRDEVQRHREMSWMRIDRYHQGDPDDVQISHQPMMCQHCDNAPCESVCPVLATIQSSDGLNQQVYNRCVGTRYCANTCPYKVRRFNWFEYPRKSELQNHALNPDVTVRSRGVMEKCSMCVQRIQEARIEARRQGVELRDGDIQVACQDSCPAQAITFGDLADPKSEVSKKAAGARAYRVLEETQVEPAVRYLAQVRNRRS